MPTRAPSRGFVNSFDERQPLLKPRTSDARVFVSPDLEVAALAESEDPKRVWKLLWYLIFNICLTVGALVPLLTATNDKEGMGSDYMPLGHSSSLEVPQFDYKWALWRALSGGLTGAAGESILYIF